MPIFNIANLRYGNVPITTVYIGASLLISSAQEIIYDNYLSVTEGVNLANNLSFFTVLQQSGWSFLYQKIDNAAKFIEPIAVEQSAKDEQQALVAREQLYKNMGLSGFILLSSSANKWNGRLIENVNSSIVPTLNLIDPIIGLRDEDGGSTPALEISTAIDPLGNQEATRLNYASYATFVSINVADYPGWTENNQLTLSAQVKQADVNPGGPGLIGFGGSGRATNVYTPTPVTVGWEAKVQTIDSYNGSNSNNISLFPPPSGNTYPFAIDVYCLQIYADSGPISLPTFAEERNSYYAGHAKASAGHPGALITDNDGWVTPNDNVPVAVVPLGRPNLVNWYIGVWVDFKKTDYTGSSYVAAAAFGNTRDSSTSALSVVGMLGMDIGVNSYGKIYGNPPLSTIASRAPTSILNQGPTHLGLRVLDNGINKDTTMFINGVPILDSARTVNIFPPEILLVGGSNNSRSRDQSGPNIMTSPDRWGDVVFDTSVFTDDDCTNVYLAGKDHFANQQRKILVIGSFDSLTAFSSSPFFNLWNKGLDNIHFMLDAIGGSEYGADLNNLPLNAYNNPERQGLRRRALLAGAKGYDEVIWLCQYGTNDLVTGVMDPNSTTWQSGRDIIDGMISDDINTVPLEYRSKIKKVILTIPPLGGWIVDDVIGQNSLREIARNEYNLDCNNNYASRGYSHVINWETYIPVGWNSLAEAAKDAAENLADNDVFQTGGIHWNGVLGLGGDAAASAVLVPFLSDRFNELNV